MSSAFFPDPKGNTDLMTAAVSGNVSEIESLCILQNKNVQYVNATNHSGKTALQLLLEANIDERVRINGVICLLKHGAQEYNLVIEKYFSSTTTPSDLIRQRVPLVDYLCLRATLSLEESIEMPPLFDNELTMLSLIDKQNQQALAISRCLLL